MFGRRSASTSAVQSRAASLSDKSMAYDELPHQSGISFAHPGSRRMHIDDDSDDDQPGTGQQSARHGLNAGMHPMWQALQEEAASLTPGSDAGSASLEFFNQANEVKTLQISNMARHCTVADVYKAFNRTRDTMRIDWKTETSAHLHFESADQALQAYFGYLSSSYSIGTVEPLEVASQVDKPMDTNLKVAQSIQPAMPPVKKRSSWTPPASTSKMMTLSSLSTWRTNGSEKTQSTSDPDIGAVPQGLFTRGHRSTSSRSSVHSKSTDRVPALGRESSTSTAVTLASESSEASAQSQSTNAQRKASAPAALPSTTQRVFSASNEANTDDHAKKEFRGLSARRFLPSGFGFGFRHSSKSKGESS
ncbi:hypothetical protein BCR37DRAFT_395503 [Protomyces lactucae-debilis]|uniref:Thc1 RRM domain-containing protein n=1 Tax=Protomyces lactucae-debilis TaxID=2754530 RepID=A0A1Y2EUX4_PROLT|nr:uncharacterized protein BCR37DRAFT_395503 [Protomyces lactucae-debilis]ORY75401.1 hypothetical protein BCR37DRAFT_395503 [Protomyces lactucae-debilis]